MAIKDCMSGGEKLSTAAKGAPVSGPAGTPGGAPAGQEASPPITDRGVEFCLHWLSVSIWRDVAGVMGWLCELIGFEGRLDAFHALPHGARGFRELAIGPGGCKVYSSPVAGAGFCSVELPGEVVASIPIGRLQSKFAELECRWQVTRVDLTFDHTYYVPEDVLGAVMAGEVRTLAKRHTLRELREPFKGGHTVYLGSRQSERMLRVYLKDGHTRTELECKRERADLIFHDLLSVEAEHWPTRGLAHMRDYVDFGPEWWSQFCQGVERAFLQLKSWAELSFARSRAWLEKQVASTLAMFEDVLGFKALIELLERGHDNYSGRHRVILAACGVAT